jgi:hypothetical protein
MCGNHKYLSLGIGTGPVLLLHLHYLITIKNQKIMRQEDLLNGQSESGTSNAQPSDAFMYLKSLPPNYDNPVLESYKKSKDSAIIDYEIAEDFTSVFRAPTEPFLIPVSWSMTKTALIALLGITDYEGYEEINGIRFYAGINGDNQLTLIAVTTQPGDGCSDDLTYEESYPYYDYARPCPDDCTNRGNLKVLSGPAAMLEVVVNTVS